VTRRAAGALVLVAAAAACRSAAKDDASERRAYVRLLEASTLAELEKARPDVRRRLDAAAGWAVFGVGGAQALGAREGVGFGVAHVAGLGHAYVRAKQEDAARAGETCRVVVVFDRSEPLRRLLVEGLTFGADPTPGVEAWQFFASGLAPAPDLAGVVVRRDESIDAR
jgi:hypothetical protein